MKKQQKIIELRTAAKCKAAELETKIAFARSEAAGKRARLMWERAAELEGLEAGGTERFDVLAKYRAKLAGVDEQLAATVAQLKFEIQQAKSECERQCADVEDDDDPKTAKEKPQPETVYCDGSEHSARIVARRLINKLPHIPAGGFMHVHIVEDGFSDNQDYFVSVWYGLGHQTVNKIFAPRRHTAEFEAAFVEKCRRLFADEDDPEPAEEKQQPETVYCDGSEHSARIVARRLVNKMPHIPAGGYLFAHVHADSDGGYFLCVTAGASRERGNVYEIFTAEYHTAEFEAAFVEKCRRLFADEPESVNSHVAEPLSRALDAVFGGNPVEQVDNLIADTVKNGKEGGNE